MVPDPNPLLNEFVRRCKDMMLPDSDDEEARAKQEMKDKDK